MVLDDTDREALAETGVYLGSADRSATIVVCDHAQACLENAANGFELLPISSALERYPWLKERYYFKAISADYNENTALCAKQDNPLGFYLHVDKGVKIVLPVQAAMYMKSENIVQMIHNVIILEEESQVQVLTGCLAGQDMKQGTHIAVGEQYIGKNARLISTMVHAWGSGQFVHTHTGTIVEEGGRFESNYVSLRPAKHFVSNPQSWLVGRGASAKYLTVVLASPGTVVETGGTVYLNAEDTSAELAHRGVCTGGILKQGGLLVGKARCKAHVDCAGMLLSGDGNGYIESVPGLQSMHPDARMSHEASIGNIAPEQVQYLMSRGMDEREAISMLIRGFLGSGIEGLGPELDERIAQIVEVAGHGEE
ncbi:MAG: SufD family Fe-S cluster assembly protein [Sphaerochaeta sp.]|nr:SufD family Fe-S cluster assembly protein [Sphaerochaeta sp.]